MIKKSMKIGVIIASIILVFLVLCAPVSFAASKNESKSEWWNDKSIRWIQTNLRETNAAIDPKKFVDDLEKFNANAVLLNAGGITAYYPTKIPYAYVNPYMPKDGDTFGNILKEAHARNIYVVSRWDFSKARKEVYDAHPEWFFKKSDGSPAIYNGLYQVCINGGWIREKSFEILSEALERYDVDGCFFNNFQNPLTDYAGDQLGLCHCDNCERLYQARFGRPVPEKPDADYRTFMNECALEVSNKIIELLREKRPHAALIGGTPNITNVVYGESATAINRPLPLWPYTASDNVNKWKNSYPNAAAVCQSMSFIDFPWRFATVPSAEIATRLWQNVANGGYAALNIHGTIDEQPDRTAIETAAPIFKWVKDHEQYYVGQRNEARIVLLAPAQGGQSGAGFEGSQDSYRGLFRLLSEQHIPFAAMTNLDWIGKRPVDLVITTGPTPKALEGYVKDGGKLIIAGTTPPEFEVAKVIKKWKKPDGAYFHVHNKQLFNSLKSTDLVMMYGDYLQLENQESPALTFVPPSMYAPPEFVGVDLKDSGLPGIAFKKIGDGTVAWLPWDIGAAYYKISSNAHAGILTNLIDNFMPKGREIITNAHPLVSITLMHQSNRYLMHFVNLAGHSDTAYFEPPLMRSIEVKVKGHFNSARAIKSNVKLETKYSGGYTIFTLPELQEYEMVELM